MKKRILSIFLALALLCALLPVTGASASSFRDVSDSAWYAGAVEYVVSHGLMNGTGGGIFEPESSMTRAMLVTVLWRYEGSPTGFYNRFYDVAEGVWYTDAISWAAAYGVVNGVEEGRFNPDGRITREQLATILFRYAAMKGYDIREYADLSGFPDAAKVSSWAQYAVAWAVGKGLISGTVINGRTLLDPQGSATRAQVATILQRFIENLRVPCDHEWTAATCFAPKTCAKCGRTEGEKLAHSVTSGTCSNCGYQIFEGLAVLYSVTQDYEQGGGCAIFFLEDHTYHAVAGGSGILVDSDGNVPNPYVGGENMTPISSGIWYQGADPSSIYCEDDSDASCALRVDSMTDPTLTKYDKQLLGLWYLTEVYDLSTDTNYSAAEFGISSEVMFYSDHYADMSIGENSYFVSWDFQYVDQDGDYLYYMFDGLDMVDAYFIVSDNQLWVYIGNYCFTYG